MVLLGRLSLLANVKLTCFYLQEVIFRIQFIILVCILTLLCSTPLAPLLDRFEALDCHFTYFQIRLGVELETGML